MPVPLAPYPTPPPAPYTPTPTNGILLFFLCLISSLMHVFHYFMLMKLLEIWISLIACLTKVVWLSGSQSQLVCSGCRNLLVYPVGATSVCCAVCNAVTAVPPPGMMQDSILPFWVSTLYIIQAFVFSQAQKWLR